MTHPFVFLKWLIAKLHFGFTAEMLEQHGFFQHVTHTWLVMAILIGVGLLATHRAGLVPDGMQNFMELVLVEIRSMVRDTMGPKGMAYFPLIATLALFLLVSNLIGLIPGFAPPTASLNTNAALAVGFFLLPTSLGCANMASSTSNILWDRSGG